MLDKFKNSNFYKKMKTQKGVRAIYLTVVVLILAVAIVAVITTAANKAKRNQPPIDGTTAMVTTHAGGTTRKPSSTTSPQGTTAPGTTTPETKATDVVSQIPDFALPVSGNLIKAHDETVQVWSSTMNDYRVHLGIDISTAEAAPVYAAAKGTISKIWEDTLMGYCIAIEHGGDSMTIYKNLQKDLPTGIAEGETVTKGQLIAVVGESAMIEVAEDPHLHFEITVDGLQVNPLEYYDSTERASLSVDTGYEN